MLMILLILEIFRKNKNLRIVRMKKLQKKTKYACRGPAIGIAAETNHGQKKIWHFQRF